MHKGTAVCLLCTAWASLRQLITESTWQAFTMLALLHMFRVNPHDGRVAGSTIWSVLGLSIVMQEQANKHIFPVQASKPARRLLRLLLVSIHCTDYQLNRVLGQQVTPASQVPVVHAEAIAACMLSLSGLQLGCKIR